MGSRLDDYLSILEAVQKGFNEPQKLAEKTGCTQASQEEMLETLLNIGMIEEEFPASNRYKITVRGQHTLSYLKKAQIDEEEKQEQEILPSATLVTIRR